MPFAVSILAKVFQKTKFLMRQSQLAKGVSLLQNSGCPIHL